MDDDQSSPQEAGPSRANRNHCTISALQVTDEESRGDVQVIMAKITMLEDQNRKLALSKSTSKQIVFALLTIRSLRTCEKRERRSQGQLWQCPPAKAANHKHRKVPRCPSFLIDSTIEEEDHLLMRPLPRHITVPSASTLSSHPHTSSAQSARRQAESEDLRAVRAILEDSRSDFGHDSREGTSQGAAGHTSDQGCNDL